MYFYKTITTQFIDQDILKRAITAHPDVSARITHMRFLPDTKQLDIEFNQQPGAEEMPIIEGVVTAHDPNVNPILNPILAVNDADTTILPHQLNVHVLSISQDITLTLPDPSVCDPLAIISIVDSLSNVHGNKRALISTPQGVEIEGPNQINQRGGKWFARPLVYLDGETLVKKWIADN